VVAIGADDIVSCVSLKRPEPALAKDLYISPWFRLARSYVEATGCPWFILSAKYGLVAPDQTLAPYQQTLNKMSVLERREWSRHGARNGDRAIAPANRSLPGRHGYPSRARPVAGLTAPPNPRQGRFRPWRLLLSRAWCSEV
jgi:hypothetical protein